MCACFKCDKYKILVCTGYCFEVTCMRRKPKWHHTHTQIEYTAVSEPVRLVSEVLFGGSWQIKKQIKKEGKDWGKQEQKAEKKAPAKPELTVTSKTDVTVHTKVTLENIRYVSDLVWNKKKVWAIQTVWKFEYLNK